MFDLHSHMLPGLDDGAADLRQSLTMARIAVEDGIQGVVCTPHWSATHYKNTRSRVLNGVEKLGQELSNHGIPLAIFAGAELRLDPSLADGIQGGKLITINDTGRFALIELPEVFSPESLEHFFWELQLQGIKPVISHPERNHSFLKNPMALYRLVKAGVLVQLTAASVLGSFGKEVQKFSFLLLKHRMCHVLATDAHETRVRAPKLAEACRVVAQTLGERLAWEMVHEIPKRIIDGMDVDVPEPIPIEPRRALSRFFFWK